MRPLRRIQHLARRKNKRLRKLSRTLRITIAKQNSGMTTYAQLWNSSLIWAMNAQEVLRKSVWIFPEEHSWLARTLEIICTNCKLGWRIRSTKFRRPNLAWTWNKWCYRTGNIIGRSNCIYVTYGILLRFLGIRWGLLGKEILYSISFIEFKDSRTLHGTRERKEIEWKLNF